MIQFSKSHLHSNLFQTKVTLKLLVLIRKLLNRFLHHQVLVQEFIILQSAFYRLIYYLQSQTLKLDRK